MSNDTLTCLPNILLAISELKKFYIRKDLQVGGKLHFRFDEI